MEIRLSYINPIDGIAFGIPCIMFSYIMKYKEQLGYFALPWASCPSSDVCSNLLCPDTDTDTSLDMGIGNMALDF